MGQPLQLAYNWRTPLVIASVGLVVCLGILIRSHPPGWVSAGAVLVLFWAGYCGVVWLRARAYLLIEGAVLTSRHWRDFERVEAHQVRAMTEVLTPAGPSYRLLLDRDGERARVLVPTAYLNRGQSSLFTWMLTQAPEATMDARSRRTLERLRTAGLVD